MPSWLEKYKRMKSHNFLNFLVSLNYYLFDYQISKTIRLLPFYVQIGDDGPHVYRFKSIKSHSMGPPESSTGWYVSA